MGDEIDGAANNDAADSAIELDKIELSAGFIKFYGLFWSKEEVSWDSNQLLGQPEGALGRGRLPANYINENAQINFWSQKGVYILYDGDLHPVYAGQAGYERKRGAALGCVGNRLHVHSKKSIFRHGWRYFSWFGLSEMNLPKPAELKKHTIDHRVISYFSNAEFNASNTLNNILSSFESVIVAGFFPRFNMRGADLKDAKIVKQFER